MRVPLFLRDHGVWFETLWHPPAYSAQRLARHLCVPGQQVAKCVLVSGPGGHCLAVLPAPCRLDLPAVAGLLGGAAHIAAEAEVAGLFSDCEWGTLPPFGSLYGVATFADPAFDADAPFVFDAHGHQQAIRMSYRDFERLERPRRALLADRC